MSGLIGHRGLLMGGGVAAPTTVTWNPSDKAANIVLSGGDLIAGRTGSDTYQSVRSTTARGASGGRWYAEFVASGPNANFILVGLATSGQSLNNFAGSTTASWGYHQSGSTYTNNNANGTGAVSFAVGDRLMVGYNAAGGQIYFGKNGTWINGGNPGSDLNHRYSMTANTTLYLMCSIFSGAAGQTVTGYFKAADFAHTMPSGYSAWES